MPLGQQCNTFLFFKHKHLCLLNESLGLFNTCFNLLIYRLNNLPKKFHVWKSTLSACEKNCFPHFPNNMHLGFHCNIWSWTTPRYNFNLLKLFLQFGLCAHWNFQNILAFVHLGGLWLNATMQKIFFTFNWFNYSCTFATYWAKIT